MGDGNTSAGVISNISGTYYVTGTNVYADATSSGSPDTLTVNIQDSQGTDITATGTATVVSPVPSDVSATVNDNGDSATLTWQAPV